MTADSDNVTGDSENHAGISQHQSERPVIFRRNDRSRSIGMGGHLGSEYASVSRFRENPAKDRFLSPLEQESLLKACRASHWEKCYLLVLMALTTGARKGELMHLKWTDIDFGQRTAYLGQTKNGRPRFLPLTQPVITELMRFRENTSFLVFHSTTSKSTPFETAKVWRRALSESGIGHCRFHDLRHTAASNLVRAGRSLFEVGTLLGHSSPQMTQRYSHLAIQDTRLMVDQVMGDLS